MDCATAQTLLRRGDESQELLAHIATCVKCRARGEATEFVRTPEARARAAKMAARAGSPLAGMLPWIIGGVAVVVIFGAGAILLWRHGNRGPTAIVTQAPVMPEPAAVAKEAEPAPAKEEPPPPEPKRKGKRGHAAAAPRPEAAAAPADDDVSAGPPNGYLSVFSTPWARLILDGKDTGRSTPIVRMTVPAGKHHVELKTRAGTSVAADAVVSKGKEARVVKTIEE